MLLKTLVLHFRPTQVPRKTLRFSLTWGLGGMAATLVGLQLVSGLLLKFSYIPTPAAAYDSVRWIATGIPYGHLVRNLHHWCSHLLVAVAILHLLRVFFTGAFHPPRQFNWVVGLGLLATVLMANFTGYLLPWDQLAYWAVTVSTGMLAYIPLVGDHLQAWMREGADVGPATLQLFYGLHSAVTPALLVIMMSWHFWRVRKAKGLVVPRQPGQAVEEKPDRAPTMPDLLLRETVVALVLVAAVLLVSVFLEAPLGDRANPGLSPNPTRAPWYFAGLQELLLHLHPVVAVSIIPAVCVAGLMLIPYLTYPVNSAGIWFASRTGRTTAVAAAVVGFLLTIGLIVADDMLLSTVSWWPDLPSIVARGVIPVGLMAAGIGLFFLVIGRRLTMNRNEAVQALFVLLLSAYAVLTLTGVWFRGPGMQLIIPW